MAKKHEKKLTLIAIRKIQIKTTIRHHFTPITLSKIKSYKTKCWRICVSNMVMKISTTVLENMFASRNSKTCAAGDTKYYIRDIHISIENKTTSKK